MKPNLLPYSLIFLGILIGLSACRAGQNGAPTTNPASATSTPVENTPTPTRTRPPRTVFVRPTLAVTETQAITPTNDPSIPSATPNPTLESNPPNATPTPPPDQPRVSSTRTPTQTGPIPSPTSAATPAKPFVQTPPLQFLSMVDDLNGWGLTDRYILRTADGGKQWINTTPGGGFPAGSILQGFFLNVNQGWVVVPASDFLTGVLYRTSDGGNTWQSTSVPFGATQLFFLDAENGWAMADRGSSAGSQAVDIYQTTDNGQTWIAVYQMTPGQADEPGTIPYTGSKLGISFHDTLNGWITGTVSTPNTAWIFTTGDGGRTWSKQNLVIPANYQSSILAIQPPRFYGVAEGLLAVRLTQASSATSLFTTNDSGVSWQNTNPVPVSGPIDCISLQACWVWNGVTLAATEDSGKTWRQARTNVNLSSSLVLIDFTSQTNGFALSIPQIGSSILYQTVDGGKTWTPLW